MSPPLPTVGSTEDARDAVALLENADAVLVQEDGKPVGVLTRQDLLAFLSALNDCVCGLGPRRTARQLTDVLLRPALLG